MLWYSEWASQSSGYCSLLLNSVVVHLHLHWHNSALSEHLVWLSVEGAKWRMALMCYRGAGMSFENKWGSGVGCVSGAWGDTWRLGLEVQVWLLWLLSLFLEGSSLSFHLSPSLGMLSLSFHLSRSPGLWEALGKYVCHFKPQDNIGPQGRSSQECGDGREGWWNHRETWTRHVTD